MLRDVSPGREPYVYASCNQTGEKMCNLTGTSTDRTRVTSVPVCTFLLVVSRPVPFCSISRFLTRERACGASRCNGREIYGAPSCVLLFTGGYRCKRLSWRDVTDLGVTLRHSSVAPRLPRHFWNFNVIYGILLLLFSSIIYFFFDLW